MVKKQNKKKTIVKEKRDSRKKSKVKKDKTSIEVDGKDSVRKKHHYGLLFVIIILIVLIVFLFIGKRVPFF